ncbi:hypothetical protein [Nocardia crassostreae]|uniref:hypothetical protein n=1 Tax=Nocardia crassostreae TaxID=53428 RepID=UPI00082D7D53|nr:hypothetical protein [Nocardia crassostreae]
MVTIRIPVELPLFALTAAACATFLAAPAGAQTSATITLDRIMPYRVTTLGVSGTATCSGGGVAGVAIVNGSLEQMFEGGIGGPIAVQLDGPVMVDCDGTAHQWSGNLVAPGRVLPNSSGGTLTADLKQGSTVIASTGARGVYIVT